MANVSHEFRSPLSVISGYAEKGLAKHRNAFCQSYF
ncbi:hypothetical protein KHZ31_06520 [butyrate-producing bacterium]|nr:hypothetical protein [butyrate-producing bacterium]